MRTIQNMLAEMSPNGVAYILLQECVTIKNGSDYKANGDGDIPVYGSGGIIAYTNRFVYNKPSVLIPRKGSIDKLYYVETPFWNVDTVFYTIIDETKILPRFLFHFLSKEHLEKYNTAGGVPSLTQKILNKIKVPVPPLAVQAEIVRILDNFTKHTSELTAELAAELTARKTQFKNYREQVMLNNDEELVRIAEVCDVITGGEAPEDCIRVAIPDKEHPYAVWGNGKDVYGYSGMYRIDKDAVTISSIGANTGTVYFHKAYFTPIIRLKVIVPLDNSLNPRFLYHALAATRIDSKRSSVPNINASEIKALLIPFPSIDSQNRIALILDSFERLSSTVIEGISEEIEARQKQYEYYRDKLLTFPELKQ